MQGKITLITPPDFFENDTYSVLLVHMNEVDQETVSKWLAKTNMTENINIYFYDQEIETSWLFYASARCDYKFIDIDNSNNTTALLNSYFLGKKNTYYKTSNENKAAIYNHINQNRIINIEHFLERAFNDKINQS